MHALDDVAAIVEDTADVFGVHGAGKVRVAVVAPVPAGSSTHQKLITNEVLGPGHAWVLSRLRSTTRTILRSSVARELWKVVLNLRFPSKDFLSEQILLVEEQNHRDRAQPSSKEGDALEEVQSLLQAVGLVVLSNDHVVAAAGYHENDCSHIYELFILLLEVDFVHLELGLKDSRSQDTAANFAYLVSWHIVILLDDINLVQELVLVGALIAGAHSFILPQNLGMLGCAYRRKVKVRLVHHTQNVVHSELVLGVGQLHRRHQVAHGGHNGSTYFNGLLQVVFDVLHFDCLITAVGLKRKKNHIAYCPLGVLL
uniref:Uncharacterized protein n=1 Tax=Prolemur simus TaxID=1328070 RepID=A0A8C9ASJ0_PROSS